eukprot:CFRG4729T1
MGKVPRVVLFAVDWSDASLHAVQWSKDNFLRSDDQLKILWVLPDYTEVDMDDNGHISVPSDCSKQTKQKVERANHMLQDLKADLEKDEYDLELFVESGDPRGFIPLYSDKLEADTVIMGNRGTNSIKKMLLGSVSDYCVHECKCPVLIVRRKGDIES